MTAILLEPHFDDAVLFACYTLLEWQPTVITVFGKAEIEEERYGVTFETRWQEHCAALNTLGLKAQRWLISDKDPDPDELRRGLIDLADSTPGDAMVFIPAHIDGGHEQHNLLAMEAWGAFYAHDHVHRYMTYRRGDGTRHIGRVEHVASPGWRARKLRAMSCYASQIDLETMEPWFRDPLMLREWLAE